MLQSDVRVTRSCLFFHHHPSRGFRTTVHSETDTPFRLAVSDLGSDFQRPVYTCDISCDFAYKTCHSLSRKGLHAFCTRNPARNRIKNRMCKRALMRFVTSCLLSDTAKITKEITIRHSVSGATPKYREAPLLFDGPKCIVLKLF